MFQFSNILLVICIKQGSQGGIMVIMDCSQAFRLCLIIDNKKRWIISSSWILDTLPP